ncbi:MAG: ArsA family ATPase [Thermoplasmatales archaeon]|nr:ArsA family ATPase [Thermoplasmatales archaeon]
MRLIIFTGKGGVGKTTVAAATAIRAAEMGQRTLLMGASASLSMSDLLGVDTGGSIVNVSENLDAIRIDALREVKERWGIVQDYIADLAVSRGMERLSAEEMIVFPGIEFMASMAYVYEAEAGGEYDLVVVDTSSVTDTLRLLRIQDTFGKYTDFMLEILKTSKGFGRSFAARMVGIPVPSDRLIATVEDVLLTMEAAAEIYEDPEKTSVRLVMGPDRLSGMEARRAYTQICFFNRPLDAVVVNSTYCEGEVDAKAVAKEFEPLKVLTAPHVPGGAGDLEGLSALGKAIYGKDRPDTLYNPESPLSFTETDDGMTMRLYLPFVGKEDVELFKSGDSGILIHMGDLKNRITLPKAYSGAKLTGADMEGGALVIRFRGG